MNFQLNNKKLNHEYSFFLSSIALGLVFLWNKFQKNFCYEKILFWGMHNNNTATFPEETSALDIFKKWMECFLLFKLFLFLVCYFKVFVKTFSFYVYSNCCYRRKQNEMQTECGARHFVQILIKNWAASKH